MQKCLLLRIFKYSVPNKVENKIISIIRIVTRLKLLPRLT